MDETYLRMIALLPGSRFSELRNRYAFVIMQAAIFTFNTRSHKRGVAQQWIVNAESLAVSPELKNQITDKLFEFKKIRKKSMPVPVRIIIIAIVVGSNLFRLFNSDNSTSQSFPAYKLPVITPDTTKGKTSLSRDSLLLRYPSPMK